MIHRYKNFLLEMLCESIMVSTREFLKLIEDMPSDNKIADDIYNLFHRGKDVKTNYNAIGVSDKNDEVTFIPDSQYQRIVNIGEDPWTKTKSKSKIGRMIRQILNDNPGVLSSNKYTDAQIEEFVNLFKAAWDKKMSTKREIKIVKGEDIKYWYNEKNYLEHGGTLGNSCMRHSNKSEYMNIYASNPDKISLVILTENDKLIARSILWKIDESDDGIKYYLDRIYVRWDSDYEFVNDWVVENVAKRDTKIIGSYQKGYSNPMKCYLKNVDHDYYPYADTFTFLYKKLEDGKVVNGSFIANRFNSSLFDRYMCLELQNTDGSSDNKSHRWSEYSGKYIERTKAVYVEEIGDYMDKDEVVKCEFNGNYYLKKSVIFSKAMNMWIPSDESIDHPKYGIVMSSAIKNVVKSVDESKDNLIIFLEALNNDFNSFIFDERFDNSETWFEPYNVIHRNLSYFDNKYFIEDIYGDSYPSVFCLKLYKVANPSDLNENIPYYHGRGKYIIKEYSDIYNIDIEEQFIYMYIRTFVNNVISYHFYTNYLKTNDKKHTKFFENLHNIKLKVNNYYNEIYQSTQVISKKFESPELLLLSVTNESIDEALKSQDVLSYIENEFSYVKRNYSNVPDIDQEVRTFIFSTYKILFIYHFLFESKSASLRELYNYLEKNYPDELELAKKLENSIYYSFFDAAYDTVRRSFNLKLDKFITENNLEVGLNTFKNILQELLSLENIRNMKIEL